MLWFIQKEFVATIIIQVDFEVTPAVRHDTEAGYRGDSHEMEFPGEGFCFQSLGRGSGTTGSVTMSVMMKNSDFHADGVSRQIRRLVGT